VVVPHPAYRRQGFAARTQSLRLSDQSGLLNLKKQRGTAQVPQPLCVPPIRVLGAGDQNPFPLTTQWKLTSTWPNSPLSLYKKFWQCGILT